MNHQDIRVQFQKKLLTELFLSPNLSHSHLKVLQQKQGGAKEKIRKTDKISVRDFLKIFFI